MKSELRAKLGFLPSKTVWLSVGHLSMLKDPVFLIRVWKKLFTRASDPLLIFIGDGLLAERCRAESQGCKNIMIKGRVANVPEYLQASDYFISSSKAEGLPNSVMEAMACGLPCVLSGINVHKEIHTLNSLSGAVYVLDSMESLAVAMNSVTKNEYSLMKEASLEIAREHLNAKIMSEKYRRHLYSESTAIMRFSLLMSIYHKEYPVFFDIAMRSIWDEQTVKPDEIVWLKTGLSAIILNPRLNSGRAD